ncbi:MAG: alpha/beta hydrolase family protein [Planctomycetota bacterium]|jgi:putative redox protein
MMVQKVQFQSGAGQQLSGIVELPEGEPKGFALFAHCFTCGKSLGVIRTIASQLTAEGIGLLRFDFTGLGQSEGEFAQTTFTTNLDDLIAAARFLDREYQAPSILIGHSLGGAAVLATAASIESTRCVAVIGAPSEPTHVKHLLTSADFDEHDTAEISIGGRPFRIGRRFIDDLETHDLASETARMRKPLIIFHSPADTIVGIDNAEKIYRAARHPKSFVSLGSADHLVSEPQDAAFLGHVLSAWAGYYAAG